MKFYCIADEDTARGFRLAGIEGESVANPAEAEAALARASMQPEIGVLVLTDIIAAELRALVNEIRLERGHPLIVEIPGPEGPMPGRKTLREFVQEAVGIRVGQEDRK